MADAEAARPIKLPTWVKIAAVAIPLMSGGGFVLADYIPVKVESVYETKEAADKEHKAIREEMKALPSAVVDEIERRRGLRR